jgi:hypothetical protein
MEEKYVHNSQCENAFLSFSLRADIRAERDTASGILRDGLLGIEVQCHKNELFSKCRTES